MTTFEDYLFDKGLVNLSKEEREEVFALYRKEIYMPITERNFRKRRKGLRSGWTLGSLGN